ncbi:MAG: ABC transporter ATP-binding protein, partial [Cyclobacteriaceae bacterium]
MLKVQNIRKVYGATTAVDQVSFEVKEGEILSLTGESGCGKSTLLRIIGGLENADSGAIFLEGKDISRWKPERRRFGFVFQNLSLFPHLTVEKNIFFAMSKEQKDSRKLTELLGMTGMTGFEKRYPHELSGGQQQRVALARALSIDPKLLILDEPFSSLDELVKEKIRKEVFDLLKELNITTIMVSHQAFDSFLIADKLVVMQQGKVLQVGDPIEIYQNPTSQYVSNFFGASVILSGTNHGQKAHTSFGDITLPNLPQTFSLCIRPENIVVKNKLDFNISGIVKEKLFKGPHDVLTIQSESSDE